MIIYVGMLVHARILSPDYLAKDFGSQNSPQHACSVVLNPVKSSLIILLV